MPSQGGGKEFNMEYFASDYRRMAREALHGRWPLAILASLIASLIGARIVSSGSSGPELNAENYPQLSVGEITPMGITVIRSALGAVLVYLVVLAIISGAGSLGYARFQLNLVDGKRASIRDLFSQFHRLGDGFLMNLLMGLYLFLWTMLFIIPGIVKSYSYAMTPYILAEDHRCSANDAITESRRIMNGNRWRLFCLHFSFIGWDLLCSLPSFIGFLLTVSGTVAIWLYIPFVLGSGVLSCFLQPYKEAAQAAFYRDITTEVYSTEEAWHTGDTQAL